MRIFLLKLLFVSIFFLTACQNKELKKETPHKYLLTSNLIKQCVDSTRVLDSAINTKTFCVDIHLLRKEDPAALDLFLNENKNVKAINLDSLEMVKSDWLRNEFKQNDVIRFEKIEEKGDSLIITISQNRYIIASFGAEITFKRDSLNYKCLSNKMTWVY